METLLTNPTCQLIGSELIKTTISNFVNIILKPKLEKWSNIKNETISIENIELIISNYLERAYDRTSFINTIVFSNQQKSINDLYIPLTIKAINSSESDKDESIIINKYDDEFINKYRKILIVDNAGMGKSTIIKYLFLQAIKENKGIPILIELRKLTNNIDIVEFIANELQGIKDVLDIKDLATFIETGEFIFFFDGYDEIIKEHKRNVTESIENFISKANKNIFFISSREESELKAFNNFKRFFIKPLSQSEAFSLLYRHDNNGEISKTLVEKLKQENMKIIGEFLRNPLMVSLLYGAYRYKQVIPNKKYSFYRQVYEALYQDHDLSKGGAFRRPKYSGLDIEEFHLVLRYVGFISLKYGVSYSKETLINIIKNAKTKIIGAEFSENNFIDDIIHSVPLFIEEGCEYRWAHKSFQEYFAASYICFDSKQQQANLLNKISSENLISKYYNVLDFCYDMEEKEFMKIIIYPLINDFINFFHTNYINDLYKNYDKDIIKTRKELTFNLYNYAIRVLDEETAMHFIKTIHKKNSIDKYFDGIDYNATHIEMSNIPLACVFKVKREVMLILNLLYIKGVDYVKVVHVNRTKKLPKKIQTVIKNEIGILNDDINNKLNSKEAFNTINKLLSSTIRSGRMKSGLCLDYEKCCELKVKIENHIEMDEYELDLDDL